MKKTGLALTLTGLALALLQLIDIVLHAATAQLEALRVSANLLILLWLALTASGRLKSRFPQTAAAATGAYLLLNLVFLAGAGLTNPALGGAVRAALLLLVSLTLVFSGLFTILHGKKH
jgi:hypothetical protein